MCDLIVVLGGDGRSSAWRPHRPIGGRRPDCRREFRKPGIPDRDHAAGALPVARGRARRHGADRRTDDAALTHVARRRGYADRLALNDVVITGRVSRIIDLSVAIGDVP